MIDPSMVIKSTIDGTLWSILNEIPMFDRHQQYFPVHQMSPPRQAKKLTAHFKLQMARTISHLKHNHQVVFLQEWKIWITNLTICLRPRKSPPSEE
eukprot:scaffold131908_cov53-Attheya_sp.AAC.3